MSRDKQGRGSRARRGATQSSGSSNKTTTITTPATVFAGQRGDRKIANRDLPQPQHHASEGVDAAPTSFKDAGEERRNSGKAESRGRERENGWGLGFWFAEQNNRRGVSFWVSLGFLIFGFSKTTNKKGKFRVYLPKRTDNIKGWEPDFDFLFGPNTAQLNAQNSKYKIILIIITL